MNLKTIGAVVVMAIAAAACQQIPDNMTVVEYCSNPDNLNKDVCKVNVEVDGQKRALAETNMSLSQARQIADNALSRANNAQRSADEARAVADKALTQAQFNCETKTVQRSKTGTCGEGYKVLSCVQTRFTYRAGAPSILREISDSGCRFNDQVLEMQVRCCTAGPAPVSTEAAAPVVEQPTQPTTPQQSS